MNECPACHQPNVERTSFCALCGCCLAIGATPPGHATIPSLPKLPALPDETHQPLNREHLVTPDQHTHSDQQPQPAKQAQQAHMAVSVSPAALAVATTYLPFGFLVDGKYAIDSVIGEGGMGVVYLATDIHTKTPVVVKAIRLQFATQEEFRERVLYEGRALASIDHQNVVRLNAVVVEREELFLIMQFVDGESLEKTIQRYVDQRLYMPLGLVISIFGQALAGVGAAHAVGVIHRDIKPANILIRQRDATVKVTDFGIAKDEDDIRAGKGKTKGILGSIWYMAPEQIKGQRDLDCRVDIYALGIMLFEMLVGRVPFDAPNEFDIMKMHIEEPVPSVASFRRDIPPLVDAVIQRSCAKDRRIRFANTSEMARALLSAVSRLCPAVTPDIRGSQLELHDPRLSIPHNEADVAPSRQSVIALVEPPAAPASPVLSVNSDSANRETPKSSLLKRALLTVGLVVLGGGIVIAGLAIWMMHYDNTHPRRGLRTRSSADSSDSAFSTAGLPGANRGTAGASQLEALAGPWVSDSGIKYDATMHADILAFSYHDTSSVAKDGYQQGEAVFELETIRGETSVFDVNSIIRFSPPQGYSYDLPGARNTCITVRKEVSGSRLKARYDGTKLIVDLARVSPDTSAFVKKGTKIISCERPDASTAGLSRNTLSRLP